ncbi:MAG: hypothetical protein A2139_11110 [Desulfobacca sp. RBG_16_60_12]|nr:MAG: hypothetical protein A2139_11110 [Desulfobacca sp. RBG_16_60_12]
MRAEQLCIDTICYNAFPLERALAGIAECGIRRVELCSSVDSCDHAAPERLGRGGSGILLRLLESYGLTAVSFSGHADITTEAGLVAFTARLQLAGDMSIPIAITPLPPEEAGPEVEERFCRNAVRLADLAAKLGIVMCLENLGFLMGTSAQCVALLQRLKHPNIRINYDPAAGIYFTGDKPTKDDIAVLGPHLAHFHVNDKASLEKGKWDFRPIGEGIVEWDSILGELDRVGFTGPASIELEWEVPPKLPEVVDSAVRRSIQFLQKYFKAN